MGMLQNIEFQREVKEFLSQILVMYDGIIPVCISDIPSIVFQEL